MAQVPGGLAALTCMWERPRDAQVTTWCSSTPTTDTPSRRVGSGQPTHGLDLDRVPASVPVHAQVPGQGRHGGVVVLERVRTLSVQAIGTTDTLARAILEPAVIEVVYLMRLLGTDRPRAVRLMASLLAISKG